MQVGVPYISRMILKDKPLPVMMLQEGMAVVYEAGGGEYGPWGLTGLKAIEAEAKYVLDRVHDPIHVSLANTAWLAGPRKGGFGG